MNLEYVLALIFGFFSMAVPVIFILFSKLINNKEPSDEVEASSYESSEETIGTDRTIFSNYLPYFTLFLPFEIIAVIVLLWSATAFSLPFYTNIAYLVLVALCALGSFIGFKHANLR